MAAIHCSIWVEKNLKILVVGILIFSGWPPLSWLIPIRSSFGTVLRTGPITLADS